MIDSYHLYLSASEAMLRRQSGMPWRRRVEQLGAWRWDASRPASLMLERFAPRGRLRAPLHVYVGSALSKFMAFDLPVGLRSPQEQRAAAQAQMQHQLGLNAADWELALDAGTGVGKSVACAVPRQVSARVAMLASEHRLRLVSLRPYVTAVWNMVRAQNSRATDGGAPSALLALEGDAFSILMERSGQMVAVSAMRHGREAGLVEREIKRLGYALGADGQSRIQLALSAQLDGIAPAHAGKIVRNPAGAPACLYIDFRDLLLPGVAVEGGA